MKATKEAASAPQQAGGERARRRARLVADVCRQIEAADTPPGLDELAARAGVSPFQLHRAFKAETGLTPRAYAQAQRAQRLRGDRKSVV